MERELREKCLDWFIANRRDLPWRKNTNGYRVWISEIMLQQTRVESVLSYYQKWMCLFPDIKRLAQAPISLVIKTWEGLGYYSRARNLHLGAKMIVQQYGGIFPSIQEELLKIPGIGSYTAGAILLFAFHKVAPAVDGNVLRVLARFRGIEENIAKQKTRKHIEQLEMQILKKEKQFFLLAEALIELGALICKKKPLCMQCPLAKKCVANLQNATERIPVHISDTEKIKKDRLLLVVEHDQFFLVKKNEEKTVMQDLYEFVYFDNFRTFHESVKKQIPHALLIKTRYPPLKQFYTKYAVTVFPYHVLASKRFAFKNFQWIHIQDLQLLPFSSAHSKILRIIRKITI